MLPPLFFHPTYSNRRTSGIPLRTSKMNGSPFPGAPLCTSLNALRHAVENISTTHQPALHTRSNNVLATARRTDCLPIHFITDSPSSLLLLGTIHETLRTTPPTQSSSYAAAVVLLCNWREKNIHKVIRTLEMHAHHSIHETAPNSQIWIVRSENTTSRLILTLGDPDRRDIKGGDEAFYALVAKSERRAADLIGRVARDTQTGDFLVTVVGGPVMLFVLPEWFWCCVRAVMMVGAITTTTTSSSSTSDKQTFTLSDPLAQAQSHFTCIVNQAKNRFPILHIDFTYSSSSQTLKSLHSLPGWSALWPKMLHADVYSRLLSKGMDALYLSLIRLAASAPGRYVSPESCAANAKTMFEGKHGGGRPWLDGAARPQSYTVDNCALDATLATLPSVVAAADCPVDASASALAALIPRYTPPLPSSEFIAARVAWRVDAAGRGVEVALSGDSPQYILLALIPAAGREAEEGVRAAWKGFARGVEGRAESGPKTTRPMAQAWREFYEGSKALVGMLVGDEEERERKDGGGGGGGVKVVQERLRRGNMTVICQRSLA